MAKVLVADDESGICEVFAELLRREGHTPLIASSGEQALEIVAEQSPDLVFLDIQMPGMSGLEAFARIREQAPQLSVVIMTAYGTMQAAMDAVRLGALDYLGKPVELAQVRRLLARALHDPQAPAPSGLVDSALASDRQELVGQSAAMQEVFKLIGLVSGNELNVLICGESGVGKELVARAVHSHSARARRPFVAINCAAIPENLIESELFGHEKGAFTGAESRRIGRFEAAGEGTVFLDEISELPYHLQGKLLRVLQERSFERVGSVSPLPLEARVIAASNRDLGLEVAQRRFREDLYHRLDLVTLQIPPLRKRKDDIALLAAHFLHRACAELGKSIGGIEPQALSRLKAYNWPGNVRELEHTIKRAVLMSYGPNLSVHDIAFNRGGSGADAPPGGTDATSLADSARMALHEALARGDRPVDGLFYALVGEVEYALITEALRVTDGNQVATSQLLGLHRTTLRKKLAENASRG